MKDMEKDDTHPGKGNELKQIHEAQEKNDGHKNESRHESKGDDMGYGKHGMKAHMSHAVSYLEKQKDKDCL